MGKRTEAFVEVVKVNFKLLFQYKWTFAMSLFTQPIIFIINYIIFQSIYSDFVSFYSYLPNIIMPKLYFTDLISRSFATSLPFFHIIFIDQFFNFS